MELLFIVVSLVIQIGSTEGTCYCLDQTLCGDSVSGCKYRCQPGFTGKNCQHDNLGYLSASNAKKLFDGDYSTCLSLPTGTKINFIQPIDVDTIRVHREDNNTRKFYSHVYINTRRVSLWRNYQVRDEGPSAATYFPIQTGVTAVMIDEMRMACEVELTNANECASGRYGHNCWSECSEGCNSGTCDHVSGRCSCKPGWRDDRCSQTCRKGFYGSGCQQRCAAGCEKGDCNHVDGSCVCKPGWISDKCSEKCRPGFYGANCETPCNEGCQPQHCNHVTGVCSYMCLDGWRGRRCDTKCRSGQYGPQCKKTCRPNCRTCHHVNGSCGHDCRSGWFRENCDSRCEAGTYGNGCYSRCNEGCVPERCDPINGDCTGHCRNGWTGHNCLHPCVSGVYGESCSSNCSEGCVNKSCNRSDGACVDCLIGWTHSDKYLRCDKECDNGTFGKGCVEQCSVNCLNRICHYEHGACLLGCNEGWKGDSCQEHQECPHGTYGQDCHAVCSEGCERETCHHVSGNCSCKDGWTGEKCSEPTIAGPTAPSSGYVERSDLDCSAGQMHVHIPLSLLPIHTVTLRDPTCKVTSNGTHLVADVGLNECGTTVSFTNNSVIFTNDIVATVRLAAGVTTSNIIDYGLNKDNQRVAISCVFPRENRIDFGYVPLQRKAHFYEKQYGNLIFEINQYQDEQFTRMLPHTGLPIGVTLNTEIFIDIAVDHNSNKGVGITVESCIATPTQSPADPVWYPLIKNGCPVQSDIRTFSSPDENEFRFSFLAFKFTRSPLQKIDPSLPASPMVYLHCQVFACPRQNCTSSCQGHSRSRREAESENAHLVSAGPFYLKSEEESQGYSGGIVAGTLSVACLTTLIALVAVVAWRRSVNKLSRYQNAQMTS